MNISRPIFLFLLVLFCFVGAMVFVAQAADQAAASAKPPGVEKTPKQILAAMSSPKLAERLGLSDEQKTKAAALLVEISAAVEKAGAAQADQAKAVAAGQEKLAALLTEEQRAKWTKMQAGHGKAAEKKKNPNKGKATASATATPPAATPPPATPAAATPPAATPPPASPAAPAATPPAATPPPAAKSPSATDVKAEKEPRLRFNFRFQAWADVLDWFAKQADLALVLDAPVPGTFNYTDSNEYTPTEAIDLLNGVLLTKGYTLIRRDRMLMVVNLQDGMPEGMVPRVAVGDLASRGRFEIVSVLLPLDKRNVEEVNKEIAPLLGPYGKCVPLAKTNQLLVTDTAGILQAVEAMIKSIPEPRAQKPAEKPKAGEKTKPAAPTLVVYPVKTADSKVAVEVLQALLPDAKIVLDGKAEQINVYAVPAHQAVVKSVLEQMQANNVPEKRPRLEVYNLDKRGFAKGGGKEGRRRGGQLISTLQVLVPNARVTVDFKTGKLVVWGTPEEHATIAGTLEKLRGGSSPSDTVQIEVHRLTTVEPADALALLNKLLPESQFAVDANSRSLIAIALPEDQAAIRSTLAELQGDTSSGNSQRSLQSYRLSKAASPTLVVGLQQLAPAARISLDPSGLLLTVVACDADQKAIEAAVKQIDEPVANRQLEVYRLDDLTSTSTMALLRTLVPRAELSFDAETQNLVVLGVTADQKTIQATLEQLRAEHEGAGAVELLFYPLDQSPPPSLIAGLQRLTPKATITLEADGKRLMVVANAADHAKVAAALKRLTENIPPQTSRFEIYTIQGADAATLLATLVPLVPEAKLSVDPKRNRLLAWGTEADHKLLKNAVGQLEDGTLAQGSRKLVIHKLSTANPATVLGLLQSMVPGATLSVDAPTHSLIAQASPEDQETIRRTIEQLEDPDEKTLPVMRFHELMQVPPSSLVTGLTQLFPKAKITLDGKRLMVVADEKNQEAVKATIARIETTMPIAEPKKLATYPVTSAEKARFNAILPMVTAEMPGLTVVADAEPGVLTIWAKPTQHVLLAEIISQLKLDVPDEQKHRFVGYPIASADPTVVLATLQSLLPEARLSLDPRTRRLLAWCSPADHEKIKQALAQMDSGSAEDAQDQLMVYPVHDTNPTVALQVLTQAVPGVQFHSDPTAGTIIARARKSDHKIIAKTLTAMQASQDLGLKQVFEVYSTGESNPATVVASISGQVPKAQLVPDPGRGRISVWASSKDQETIRLAVEKLAKAEDAETAPTVATYKLGRLLPGPTMRMLRAIAPKAQVAVGADARKVIVWARPVDQQRIEQTFERMQSDSTGDEEAKVVVYELDSTPYTTAIQMIAQVVPAAIVSRGSDARQLVVWALPSDHEKIKTVVDQLAAGNPNATLKTYTLASVTPRVAMPIIRQTAPQAIISGGIDPQQLIVRARPADHEKIAAVIAQLAVQEDPKTAPTLKIYTLESVAPHVAMPIIRQTAPQAIISPGNDPQQLIVRARPADHEKIAAIIAQLSVKENPETAPMLVVYTLESTTAASLLPILRGAAPRAQFTVGSEPHKLIVHARPNDHAIIKAAVDEVEKGDKGETASKAIVYEVDMASPYRLIAGLTRMVPTARFTTGADPGQIVAWARPVDHAKIKTIIDEVGKKKPGKMVVYTLDSTQASSVMPTLRLAAPRARLSVGTNPQTLIVWAGDDDHAVIKAAIDEIAKSESGTAASVPVVYKVGAVPASQVISGLRTIVPNALFTVGAERNQLVAWARPSDQEKIKKIVDEMSKKQPGKMVVYTLETTTAAAAIKVLTQAFPDTRFAVGTDARQLIAWVSEEEQQRLADAVKQLSQDQLGENAPTAEVYTLKTGSFSSALVSLRRAVPEAKLILGSDPRQLTAWARPGDHKKIAQIVEQMTKTREPVTRVYYFRTADPRAAMTVLTALIPTARMAVNAQNHSLAVSAGPEDHEKIKAAVEQIDKEGDAEQAMKLEAHRITSADPAKLFAMLRTFFRRNPEVQLSLDDENETVMALATPRDHKKIKALIEEVEKGSSPEVAPKVEVYSLKNVDSDALQEVLKKLLEKDLAKVQLSVDSRSDQLVAIARPKHQEIIRETIDRLRTEEQTLEIFQLDTIDPSTATLAIDRLFDSGGYGYDPTAPVVDIDEDTQQLFISANKEQHEKIRALLIKMGETNLKNVTAQQQRTMRVVPFRGDVRATLEEIRRVWPQLRDNPIEVVDAELNKKNVPQKVKEEVKEKAEPEEASGNEKPQADKEKKVEPKTPDKSAKYGPGPSPGAVFHLVSMSTEETSDTAKPQAAAVKSKDEGKLPVFLIPGRNAITVKSEDPQALEQMESLLRSLAPQNAYGRNIGVFELKNTDAVRIAARLEQVMQDMRPRWQRNQKRTMIVADERLNAIVVKGNRADRETIESMVRILDAPESPESLGSKQPKLIAVKNTEASRVERVVREVFASQLSRSPMQGRRGGTSRWSPRVSVDSMSNSLIVIADPPLFGQIENLVATLDTAAGDESARGLKIISLQKANASRVEKALDAAIQRSMTRRRRR